MNKLYVKLFRYVAIQTKDMIYKWSIKCYNMSTNANEEMLAGNADAEASYPDADPDAT